MNRGTKSGSAGAGGASRRRGGGRLVAAVLVVGVLALAGGAMEAVIASMDLYLRKLPIQPPGDRQTAALPRETEHWVAVGADRVESSEIVDVLGTSNYLNRLYAEKLPEGSDRSPRGAELHLAYYTGMIDTVPHVPERCFVGAGWDLRTPPRVVEVPLSTSGWVEDREAPESPKGVVYTTRLSNRWSDRPGWRIRLPRGAEKTQMLISEFVHRSSGATLWAGYFFVANGGLASRAEGVRALAFELDQDYAYYLKVQVSTSDVGSAEELAELSGSMLNDLYGEIMRCVPDWVEVELGTYPPKDGSAGDGA